MPQKIFATIEYELYLNDDVVFTYLTTGATYYYAFEESAPDIQGPNDYSDNETIQITGLSGENTLRLEARAYGYAAAEYMTPGLTPVPEPATMLLLGTGLVDLAELRRKFRN